MKKHCVKIVICTYHKKTIHMIKEFLNRSVLQTGVLKRVFHFLAVCDDLQ